MVSHRFGAVDDQLVLLPQNQPAQMHLYSFTDREPGYNYRVKARMVVPETPPQDGPAYHLDFIEVISSEKHKGNEVFEIALIQSYVPGGPTIMLGKRNGSYDFISEKITLTYQSQSVHDELEEIASHADYLRENWQKPGIQSEMKWAAIKATVTHDPDNFGKSYLASHIEFTGVD